MGDDKGLDYLLDLDGEVLTQEGGCWVKIEVRSLDKATRECPHRIRYSLTLHDRYGKRLLGFDNAHPVKSRKHGRYAGRRLAYDHKHGRPGDKGVPYVFESAEQLLVDFFAAVDVALGQMK